MPQAVSILQHKAGAVSKSMICGHVALILSVDILWVFH